MGNKINAIRPKTPRKNQIGMIRYFFSRAISNLYSNRLLTTLTISTITLAFIIISLFMLVFVNVGKGFEQWSRKVEVTIYFDNELSPQESSTLINQIKSIQGTESVSYVSKNQAFERFKERLKGQESLLDGVTPDILPASIEISLKPEFRSSENVTTFVNQLKQLKNVTDVQYGEEWVRKFTLFMQFLKSIAMLIAGFIVVSVLFIISNTIKLTIFARKDEIEILGLVGATRLFIKTPFIIEGVIQGLTGAVLALAILAGAFYILLSTSINFLSIKGGVSSLQFLPIEYILFIIAAGIILGFIGSITSLKRFINI